MIRPESLVSLIASTKVYVQVGEPSARRARTSNVPSARAFCTMRSRSPADMIELN